MVLKGLTQLGMKMNSKFHKTPLLKNAILTKVFNLFRVKFFSFYEENFLYTKKLKCTWGVWWLVMFVVGEGPEQVQLYLLGSGGELQPGVVVAQQGLQLGHVLNQSSRSVTYWYGSGSLDPCPELRIRSLLLSSVAFKMPTKIIFLLITFWRYIIYYSTKIKVIKSHKM